MPYKEMRADADGTSSEAMRQRIEAARGRQQERGFSNAQLPPKLLRKLCRPDEAGERTLERPCASSVCPPVRMTAF